MDIVTHAATILRPGGGPPGYLYGLREALSNRIQEQLSLEVISIIDSHERMFCTSKSNIIKDTIKRSAPYVFKLINSKKINRMLEKYFANRYGKVLYEIVSKEEEKFLRKLQEKKILVFHEATLAYKYFKYIGKREGQKILFMPHTPTDYSTELADTLSQFWKIDLKDYFKNKLSDYEKFVLERVDSLIVPCTEALESHFLYRDDIKQILSKIYKYELPSGVRSFEPLLDISKTKSIRKRIEKNSKIVIGFVGRYHFHKGFDIYLKIAKEAKKIYGKQIEFVSLGHGPLQEYINPLEVQNLGWKKDVYNYIAALDLIIIPNRYTYFDLLPLEAMSIGKPMIVSNTGGNKSLKKFTSGVILAENNDLNSYLEIIDDLFRMPEKLNTIGKSNYQSYNVNFSLEKFADRHITLAKKLLSSLY